LVVEIYHKSCHSGADIAPELISRSGTLESINFGQGDGWNDAAATSNYLRATSGSRIFISYLSGADIAPETTLGSLTWERTETSQRNGWNNSSTKPACTLGRVQVIAAETLPSTIAHASELVAEIDLNLPSTKPACTLGRVQAIEAETLPSTITHGRAHVVKIDLNSPISTLFYELCLYMQY
jgi:hypothetical protein